jgi:hypothetical protein
MSGGPYYLARLDNGEIGELDSSNPGGGTNTASGTAMNGLDLTATANGSKVTGIDGIPIYGAYSTDPALQPKAGQVLVCSGDPPSGTGLVKQLYWAYLPKMYQPSVVNGTASTIPSGTFVNLYLDSGTLKMRPAQLTSTHTWPAHGITTKDALTTAGTSGTDNVSKVAMGSIIGGFNAATTPYAGLLVPGHYYWLDNSGAGGYTDVRPTGTGEGHQRVGYAVSEFEMFVCCFPSDEDMGTGGSGGSASTTKTAFNSTGSTINIRSAVNLYDVSGTTHVRLADLTGTNRIEIHGFATTNIANGSSGDVQLFGILAGFGSLPIGDPMWAHDTSPGAISSNEPFQFGRTYRQQVGIAVSATELFIEPRDVEDLTYQAWIFEAATNNTGSTIAARKLVNIYPDLSNNPQIRLPDFSGTPRKISMGVTMESIANGATGKVLVQGIYGGFSGLVPGQFLWTHTGTPGAIDQNKPSDLTLAQRIGRVLDANTILFDFWDTEINIGGGGSGGGGIPSGGGFPGSAADGDLFNRSDRKQICVYYAYVGGGIWVTDTVVWDHHENIYFEVDGTKSSYPSFVLPFIDTIEIYHCLIDSIILYGVEGTTPDGSNYWLIELVGTHPGNVYYSRTTDTFIYSTGSPGTAYEPGLNTQISGGGDHSYQWRFTPVGSCNQLDISIRVALRGYFY